MALVQRCDVCGHISTVHDITGKITISIQHGDDFIAYDREETIDLCENCLRKHWTQLLKKENSKHANERIDLYAAKKKKTAE